MMIRSLYSQIPHYVWGTSKTILEKNASTISHLTCYVVNKSLPAGATVGGGEKNTCL